MSSYWPSGWFGSKGSPPANAAQHNARNFPSTNSSLPGSNAQMGAAAAASPFAAMSTSFKKWSGSGSDPATPPDDPISLDTKPKQLSPELYVQIAHMHEAKGDFATAIKQYEQALKVAPKNTQVLVELGRAYDRKGDIAKAIETYQQAIKVDPRFALAHNDLGLCYARQNDLARARESLNKAVALAPTSKLYRNNLATVLVSARQYNEAYEQLVAVHPPAIAQYNLGILANRKGDKTEAMSRFQQAASLDSNLAQASKMIDKLNGVAAQAPAAPSITEQARQYQQQWRDTARQSQADLKNQATSQLSEVKAQASQVQTQVADRVQSQVQSVDAQIGRGVQQSSTAALAAIKDAEAKIRAARQAQLAPFDPGYTSGWVPPPSDDVTPIQAVPEADAESAEGSSTYSISDEDESPILLPPTGE